MKKQSRNVKSQPKPVKKAYRIALYTDKSAGEWWTDERESEAAMEKSAIAALREATFVHTSEVVYVSVTDPENDNLFYFNANSYDLSLFDEE